MRRTVRLWRWRRNPLRRRCDAVERWAGVAAGLALAVGGPLAGIAAADATHASLDAQNQDRHPVTAVLERNAPDPSSRSGGADPGQTRAPVRWHDANGTHSAQVTVAPGSERGTRLPLWVDGHERVTEPPLSQVERSVQTAIMGGAAAGGLCALVLTAHRGLRAGLDLRRSHLWEREWEQVGPQWSGHRA